MRKLAKTSCVVLVAGIALFIGMNVQAARADILDDTYNQCVEAYNSGELNDQGLAYCNKVAQLKQQRDAQINYGNIQYGIYRQGIQTQVDVLGIGANPIIPQATDFGVGNYGN